MSRFDPKTNRSQLSNKNIPKNNLLKKKKSSDRIDSADFFSDPKIKKAMQENNIQLNYKQEPVEKKKELPSKLQNNYQVQTEND
ncbi:hypothetical protein M0813_22056 [Anaeramoeba flamelloides]|uniref:Uncharacterized protein n=1 Tax=Anaeramoeba flamelloides TaxID=1746091 RepID=A0AAV8A1S4_9EUKA|nr:hypothetical protein M0812_00598 [Anaeramoeba flamelloides]KAJ6243617.1 hypothetical protein M0813_22056 [Anaeramoeba flamelloides]